MPSFNGLGLHLGNLSHLSSAKTRSISPENFTGKKGGGALATEGTGAHAARDMGKGWKISPSVVIKSGETFTIADIEGPGAVQQIWMTPTGNWRFSILRIYWDGSDIPSVECPLGDFFACGWGEFAQVSALPVCVNPGSAFNCYWEMPFRKRCVMTVTNIADDAMTLYYQINYALTEVPDEAAYFHAQFRRTNPIPYKEVYTVVDGIKGRGQFVGMYLAWGQNNNLWWGEGEVKFYLDGDEHPTICSTGLEDYFCGSYNFDPSPKHDRGYVTYTTPYAGFHQVIRPDTDYRTQMRLGMYRFHVMDPIRFETDLKITIQALGWGYNGRWLPLQDDVASVAFWYQTLPQAPFPPLPERERLLII
ncbi:glycoside hydrolase family 172 protein [Pleomorphomonas koreensis]|uniref:glycoside hydrolase family 172 protein n=1 Tax=Pleomorphomonas koreensis TaxID=257440 RepID=UPI00041A522E|nr:glycoside hydrolase family 172 protein [Pleomorphomonas koreensis]